MAKSFLEKNSMALIDFENQTYVSYQSFPFTPIIHLIDAIYERFQSSARVRVRSRIFCNYPPTTACLASVKIAAKRLSFDEKFCNDRLMSRGKTWVDLTHSSPPPAFEAMAPTCTPADAGIISDFEFVERRHREKSKSQPLHLLNRPISAVGYSSNHGTVWTTYNLSSENSMRHAEWCLIYTLLTQRAAAPLAFGSYDLTIWVSLKPCKMCAALIVQFGLISAELIGIQVKYWKDDSGPMARQTALEQSQKPELRKTLQIVLSKI